MPNINRDDAARTVLQKAIGEAARRSSDVETEEVSYINSKLTKRGFEFKAAAPDVAARRIICAAHAHESIRRKTLGRFFNALFINQHRARHHQRLRARARSGKPTFNKQFINSLTLHKKSKGKRQK